MITLFLLFIGLILILAGFYYFLLFLYQLVKLMLLNWEIKHSEYGRFMREYKKIKKKL